MNKLAYITIFSCGSYFEIMLHEANLSYIVFTKTTRTICCFPFLDLNALLLQVL